MTIKDFENYATSKGFPYVIKIGQYKGETIYAGLLSLEQHAKLGYPLLMKASKGRVEGINRQEMKKILSEM
ncbi:MAG: hypothetical protein J6Y16_11900 [Treponema sp.]|nr:hypothetical protein [Treponema sp.]MBR6153027.1 hypothetical protein [Treponema sp.]